MSTSETIDRVFLDRADTDAALQEIADFIKQKHDQDLWICALHGRRWEFRAGTSEILTGRNRYLLSEDWGILTDTITISMEDWRSICSCLKRNLKGKGSQVI